MIDTLAELSNSLRAQADAARALVAAIGAGNRRHITGTLWSADTLVASEQSLPRAPTFTVTLADGAATQAALRGRDPGTNIAVLRLAQPASAPSIVAGEAVVGALACAYGADGAGGVTARLGVVNTVGPEWLSSAGGRIDRRIVLDMRLAAAEEGGPVLDVDGACVGITTLGPRRQVLVIPTATVDRVVPALCRDGRVARGWLGVALQPVAVPDALTEHTGDACGLMVMSLAEDGPAAKAGVLAGDIVVGVNGKPAGRFRSLLAELGPDSIGTTVELRVIRGGAVTSIGTAIEARPQ